MATSTSMKKLSIAMGFATVIALCTGSTAQAFGFTQFFGEDLNNNIDENQRPPTPNATQAHLNFIANLMSYTTEDFENLSPGSGAPTTLNNGATISGGGNVRNAPFNGLNSTSGNSFWSYSYGDSNPDQDLSIKFSQAQNSFGFFATDMGDANNGSQFSLILSLLSGGTRTVAIPHTVGSPGGSVLYYGLIADAPITGFAFQSDRTITLDGFGLDNVTVGDSKSASAPEPSTILGCLLAFGAFGAKRLQKSTRKAVKEV